MTRTAMWTERPVVVASAGIGMIGVSFGMARYGYGLLAPDIRATFRLSSGAVGLLSSASYVAYIAASAVAAPAVTRIGPRAVVAAGGVLAIAGMLIAASAQSAAVLFAGLLVAGASAGLAFPPFSDVAGELASASGSRVLAAVSAGAGWGVALAAPIALLAGSGWRLAWVSFAVVAALATLWAAVVLPAGTGGRAGTTPATARELLSGPESRRLLIASLLIGLGSSVAWTFAVDHVQNAGGLTSTQSRLFLAVVGLASVAGMLSAHLIDRVGARATFVLAALAEAAALVLLGTVPDRVPAVFVSGALFGTAYNTVVAVTVIWSARVHAARPSGGLAAIMITQAVGLLAGPPILGAIADRTGFAAVFTAAAVLLVVTTALAPRTTLRAAAAGPSARESPGPAPSQVPDRP